MQQLYNYHPTVNLIHILFEKFVVVSWCEALQFGENSRIQALKVLIEF